MVAVKLRNNDAEALLLEIRTGRNAAQETLGDQYGAFLNFPTSVVVAVRNGAGQSVYPLRTDVEPGALVTSSGRSQVSGTVAGIAVAGFFHWDLGDGVAPATHYRFTRRGQDVVPPPWAGQLPSTLHLPRVGPRDLARQQVRLRRRSQQAEHQLLALSEQVFRAVCRGPIHRAIRYRPLLDDEDVVQRGLQAACRLLPVYASPERPPCSWIAMLRLDGRRDMYREVARLDGFSADAAEAVNLARTCGLRRHSDPAVTLAELVTAAQQLGRSRPRITAPALDAALRAPALLAQEADSGTAVAGPEEMHVVQEQCRRGGEIVAVVARLVTDDPDVIRAAADGDPEALGWIGDRVVRRLAGSREGPRLARHRCWEEFQRSGQLFATPTGLDHFSQEVGPAGLAVVDRELRRAAGVR